jgi:hypothetical protein
VCVLATGTTRYAQLADRRRLEEGLIDLAELTRLAGELPRERLWGWAIPCPSPGGGGALTSRAGGHFLNGATVRRKPFVHDRQSVRLGARLQIPAVALPMANAS